MRYRFLRYFTFIAIPLLAAFAFTQSDRKSPVFETGKTAWADSVLHSLTLEEKIGQLFMVAAYSNKDEKHYTYIENLIKKYHIGGLIFFQGGPVRQAVLTNRYQKAAKVPLLIAMDAEWGLGMRLDSTISYPRQLMLGAIDDDNMIYRMGEDIAAQCKRLGVHINFAPVIDVNVNPANPVINSRSFGEDKHNVARKGFAYMKGMQDHNVLAVAKHFPGHGDTDRDSHKTLPVVKHGTSRLESVELYPFKALIDSGVGGIMVAHLYVPALDSTPGRATTLSPKVVSGLLRKKLGFEGLIFTDALNMKGVSGYYAPGEVDLLALKAGNDVLLFPEDVPKAIAYIKKAIGKGDITERELDRHVRKILLAKQWAGLDHLKPVDTRHLIADLNDIRYVRVNRQLTARSLTLLKNKGNLLPVQNLEQKKIAAVAIGGKYPDNYFKVLNRYASVKGFHLPKGSDAATQQELLDKLKNYNLIIVSFHGTNRSPSKHFGIVDSDTKLLGKIAEKIPTVLISFANPYALNHIPETAMCDAVVVAYNDREVTREMAAQLLFGGIGASGKLPVSAGTFKAGVGIRTVPVRFGFVFPEDEQMDGRFLEQAIDSIVNIGLAEKAYPGCQVLVARNGNVVLMKSYGYHTYEKKRPVREDDLYDLASITKIASTLLVLMQLDDKGLIDLGGKLENYIPELVDSTEYADLTLREILAHQAGLRPWIPFYLRTLENKVPRYDVYSLVPSEQYPYRVAENLYINKDFPDSLLQMIVNTPLKNRGEYHYSDLGYYLLKHIIENIIKQPIEQYVRTNFYIPMGMTNTTFRPREKFPLDRIVPTENDRIFRKQLVWGDVHDPGAAMMGGVGGHAGLFSNALDLAKLMQMYLNKGTYGGRRYLSQDVLAEYTRCQYCADPDNENRRGAGFDKPVRDDEGGPTCQCVSYASFGHTGFTGTISWADPAENIIYVFLSNRVHPDADNKKLIELNIRTDIMEAIYQSIIEEDSLAMN